MLLSYKTQKTSFWSNFLAFLPQKPEKQELCQNDFTLFSAFMLRQFYVKNQKNSMHRLAIKIQKTLFLALFVQIPPSTRTFPIKSIESIFKFYVAVPSCKCNCNVIVM